MEKTQTNKSFTIVDKILLAKTNYEGPEMYPFVDFEYYCKTCEKKNEVHLEPFKSGKILSELYEQHLISKKELIKNGVAKKSMAFQSHLGELILFNMPALYKFIQCENCNQQHLMVFGCGEVQPSRMLFQVSGIWRIKIE